MSANADKPSGFGRESVCSSAQLMLRIGAKVETVKALESASLIISLRRTSIFWPVDLLKFNEEFSGSEKLRCPPSSVGAFLSASSTLGSFRSGSVDSASMVADFDGVKPS